MCRQMIEEVRRGEHKAVATDVVRAVGSFFPILRREKEVHELVDRMGGIRAWSKDIRATHSAE